MMSWLEEKYIRLLSYSLRNFKQKGPRVFNFSCPVCGDSAKSKSKARGYFIQKKNSYIFYCHNGCMSSSFEKFLEKNNPSLYDEYLLEKLSNEPEKQNFQKRKKIKPKVEKNVFSSLISIKNLDNEHPAKKYLIQRKIPNPYLKELYYCEDFAKFVKSFDPEMVLKTESRIIIPLIDMQNKVLGFQGRILDSSNSLRYITFMFQKNYLKLFGLDKVNLNTKYYITEGPFDSMFIDNCIAACGTSMLTEIEKLAVNKNNVTFIFDNQPRNLAVVKKMEQVIKKNYKIFIWPEQEKTGDLNDLALKMKDLKNAKEYIKQMVDSNTFSNLSAELALTNWRKI